MGDDRSRGEGGVKRSGNMGRWGAGELWAYEEGCLIFSSLLPHLLFSLLLQFVLEFMINGYVRVGDVMRPVEAFMERGGKKGLCRLEVVSKRNVLGPGPNARVVYIDGAFNLFHVGHVEGIICMPRSFLLNIKLHIRLSTVKMFFGHLYLFGHLIFDLESVNRIILKSARQHRDFLLVVLHTDQIVSEQRGIHFPLMHLHERSLSVLACHMLMKSSLVLLWRSRKTWANQILTQFPKAWLGFLYFATHEWWGSVERVRGRLLCGGEKSEENDGWRRRYSGVMVVEEVEWKMKKKRLNH
ncbi:ethanolamine-phosphate cytidylyltransferase-like protein [Tanacetum coccineum]